MLRGPLHNRGADGLCQACGEPFPVRTIDEAAKRAFQSIVNVSGRFA